MSKRAAAVEETRRRILDAARELHTRQGIAATSWDDIAAHAGVGVGTVYRHFPTLDELVPACGRVVMRALALPHPEHADALFADVEAPEARIDQLVTEAFAVYERGAAELRVVRGERDVHPAVTQAASDLEASLAALTEAALQPLDTTDTDRRVVRAMIDLGTWESLRAQGLDAATAAAAVSDMLCARLASSVSSRP
jgi:AcrR family transcriptional regulator